MTPSKPTQQAMNQRFIVAFTKYYGKKAKFTALKTEYTPEQVTTAVQARVDAQTEVETARGKYALAVAAAKAAEAATKPTYEGAKQLVLMQYANDPAILSEFGLSARKQAAPLTAAAKQAAVLQRQATRDARHTMGTRQRQKIKGVVTPASSDASSTAPSVAPTAAAVAGSNPVTAPAASVGSAVTTQSVTGH
jgi:hypothetical protein